MKTVCVRTCLDLSLRRNSQRNNVSLRGVRNSLNEPRCLARMSLVVLFIGFLSASKGAALQAWLLFVTLACTMQSS